MTDDDKLLKARSDGSRARDLLNDEILTGAFATLRRAYADKLLATSIDQGAARETLYQAHRLVDEVEKHLHHVFDNGKLANAELDRLIAAQQPKRAGWLR
jgi:hypothetical protein